MLTPGHRGRIRKEEITLSKQKAIITTTEKQTTNPLLTSHSTGVLSSFHSQRPRKTCQYLLSFSYSFFLFLLLATLVGLEAQSLNYWTTREVPQLSFAFILNKFSTLIICRCCSGQSNDIHIAKFNGRLSAHTLLDLLKTFDSVTLPSPMILIFTCIMEKHEAPLISGTTLSKSNFLIPQPVTFRVSQGMILLILKTP